MFNFRELAFWAIDLVTGGKHYKHYADISQNSTNSAAKIDDIICYAQKHVPFYQNISASSLAELPVMSKDVYKKFDFDTFISDEYKNAKLHTVYTSGSTGSPFKVVQNKSKRRRVKCDLINCHNNIGWRLGDKFVFMRNWLFVYKRSLLKSLVQNVHSVNLAGFSDTEKEKLFKWLKRHNNTVLFGYSSAVYDFAKYVQAKFSNQPLPKLKLIVCDSDALTPKMRGYIEDIFKCPVYNRYDNEENGLLGISSSDESGFKLNTQSLFFEILKIDSDEPQEPGLMGRVVVTDMYNYAMPLLRYDTGDLAISYDHISNIKTIHKLVGRKKSCLINTSGRMVSDAEISVIPEVFTGIEKYQIIQESDKDFTFNYVGDIDDNSLDIMSNLFKKSLGYDIVLSINKVPDIATNKNGKYESSVNKTLKNE